MEFLELKNLTKIYQKDILAIDKIDLKIKDGEFLVLLGPSGCGKTTTMRMIAGLEDVTEGEIFIEGKLVNNLQPRERGVSMIFQSYAIWPHMTVFNNIAYALKIKKMSKEKINETVKKVAKMSNIEEYLNRYPSQLSGGQQQRVAVARAMAVDPKLFLMDEPLSNLDAKLRVSMRTDLKEMHKRSGATTIFVTHDQSEAMSLADRIVIMNTGTIEQIGTPNEIYHDSKTMFVADFIGSPSTNFVDVKIISKDNKLFAKNDAFELPIDDKFNDKLHGYIDKDVVFGFRPENLVLSSDEEKLFDIDVVLVEPQGSHSVIVGRLLSKQIKIVSDEVRDMKNIKTLPIKSNGIYFIFDKETEKRIC